MTMHRRLASVSVCALLINASAAQADITAIDVWSDWKNYFTSVGYEVSGTETATSAGLSVEDVRMTFTDPEISATTTLRMGNVRLNNDGGEVDVVLEDTWHIDFIATPDGTEEISGSMRIVQSGSAMRVSGDPGNTLYKHSASDMTFTMDGLNVDGANLGSDLMSMTFSIANPASTTRVTDGDLRTYDQSMTADGLDYQFGFSDPDSGDKFSMNGAISGLSFSGKGDIPANVNMQDINALMLAGFGFGGQFQFGNGRSDMEFSGPSGNGAFNTSNSGGTFEMSMSNQGIAYETTSSGLAVNAQVDVLPLPLSFAAEEVAFKVAMPVAKTDDPQNLGAGIKLAGFTMTDVIWGMFDPTGQLPRDPATLDIDLSGKARLFFDLFDPEQTARFDQMQEAPGEIDALNLNRLVLDMVGAKLTGTGAFTFDNNDKATFGGLPKPTGAIDLQLVGGNTLIDKLVGMRLLPQEQAMGARMMMGLFARPGEGADSLVSKIEINDQGHILANGQRIQ